MMIENAQPKELNDRLNLIEDMIAEGRCATGNWGWSFVLWGVAYYVATAWATWGHSNLAWPITMLTAGALTGIIERVMHKRLGTTTVIGRALSAIWSVMGIAVFILLMSLAKSGHYDANLFVGIIGAMLGAANAMSATILRWKAQFACAVIWTAAMVTACFGSVRQAGIAFMAAVFVCQILFGIYVMFLESRRRTERGVVHA